MKLLVATDAHVFKTPDGKHWVKSIYGYDFWKRYLNVFDDVKIVARTKDVETLNGKNLLVDGNHVEVYEIPFYQGPTQLLSRYLEIQKALHRVDLDCDAALLRMPSQTAYMTYKHLRKGIPVAGEIVYDIYDAMKHNQQNIISKILATVRSRRLAKFCIKANGVSYVTEKTIQQHYPSFAKIYGESKEHFESSYSTITLQKEAFLGERNFHDTNKITLAISNVAMNTERKGEKVLLEVVKILREKQFEVKAIIIGDGSMRSIFEMYAKELQIEKFVEFTGLLSSSDEVRKVLLQADIYVFPTKGEGLPRGIIEAMAIGMPVISTPVGGIPEVIEKEYLFSPNDASGIAAKIEELMMHPDELTRMSRVNFAKSQEFENSRLQKKRDLFYQKLKNLCK